MSYSVDFTAKALVNQERLTQAVQDRIGNKINWLAENFEQITPMPLGDVPHKTAAQHSSEIDNLFLDF